MGQYELCCQTPPATILRPGAAWEKKLRPKTHPTSELFTWARLRCPGKLAKKLCSDLAASEGTHLHKRRLPSQWQKTNAVIVTMLIHNADNDHSIIMNVPITLRIVAMAKVMMVTLTRKIQPHIAPGSKLQQPRAHGL